MLEGNTSDARRAGDESGAPDDALPPQRSLAEDIEALYEDGKTYAEAELAFQKTRARFVAGHGKVGLAFGVLAVFLLHMALIGLTVGAILVLLPLVGALFATLIVVATLLLLAVVTAMLAKSRFGRIGKAFDGGTR